MIIVRNYLSFFELARIWRTNNTHLDFKLKIKDTDYLFGLEMSILMLRIKILLALILYSSQPARLTNVF